MNAAIEPNQKAHGAPVATHHPLPDFKRDCLSGPKKWYVIRAKRRVNAAAKSRDLVFCDECMMQAGARSPFDSFPSVSPQGRLSTVHWFSLRSNHASLGMTGRWWWLERLGWD